jgi:sugar transferase EpsL
MKQHGWRLVAKRALDITAATGGLLATAPIQLAAALSIRIAMGSPVLFRQSRPGLRGKAFTILKFRTMVDERDSDGRPVPDQKRLTPVGRFLRSCSIDELPQLWNVLRGEISLVGPRPLLHEYMSRYTPDQARRHEVLPGITGWAQINGRNSLSWEEKFRLDLWYVENWSLHLDLIILLRTIAQVAFRRGISSLGHATMPEFLGVEPSIENRGE